MLTADPGYQNVPKPPTVNVKPPPGDVPNPANPAQVAALAGGAAVASPVADLGIPNISPALPAAPAVTAPAVGTPGGWQTPDYQSLLAGDWQVLDAQAAGTEAKGKAEAAFQEALRQAFINYGGDTSKLGDWAKYIDQATIDAAQANKYSAMAQAAKAYSQNLARSRNRLAGRGMLSSGATTVQTKDILDALEQNQYTGLQNFLGQARTGESQLNDVLAQIAQRIADARAAAAERLTQQYPATYTEPTPAGIPALPGSADWQQPSEPAATWGDWGTWGDPGYEWTKWLGKV